jgi:hypothetical protein
MKFIKLKLSDYSLVSGAIALLEIGAKMGSDGLPVDQVKSDLEARIEELIIQYKQDPDSYKKNIEEIKSNPSLMDVIKKMKSNPLDSYIGNVNGFIEDEILTIVVGDHDQTSGNAIKASWGDFLLSPTEEYGLAVYKATQDLQDKEKFNGDNDEYHKKFAYLVNNYTEMFQNDQALFLREFSSTVPPEKIGELSRFVSDLLSLAIIEAEKSNTVKVMVMGGLEKKFVKFRKLES